MPEIAQLKKQCGCDVQQNPDEKLPGTLYLAFCIFAKRFYHILLPVVGSVTSWLPANIAALHSDDFLK